MLDYLYNMFMDAAENAHMPKVDVAYYSPPDLIEIRCRTCDVVVYRGVESNLLDGFDSVNVHQREKHGGGTITWTKTSQEE